MSVLADHQIRKLCMFQDADKAGKWEIRADPMIHPFHNESINKNINGERVPSFGLSSYGYDVALGNEFKVFTNVHTSMIDPMDFDENCFVDVHKDDGDFIIIQPNSFILAVTKEYFVIPRDVVVTCLGKSTYARCFSGDTKVALVGGESVSFVDMVERAKNGERFFGYGITSKSGVQVVELVAPRLINTGEKLLRITLDNGETIDCTPDHKFLTRKGKYVEAKDLEDGDSLMPLYRYECRGREVCYDPVYGVLEATYRLSDAYNLRHGIYSEGVGMHRHHVDHNKRNDDPRNIERMLGKSHIQLHNEEYYGDGFDEILHSDRIREAIKTLSLDPDWYSAYCAMQSEKASNFWNDPAYAESRAALSSKRRDYWAIESNRKAHGDKIRKLRNSKKGKKAYAGRVYEQRTKLDDSEVESLLLETKSIKATSKILGCSKSLLGRRYPELIATLKANGTLYSGEASVLNRKLVRKALKEHGSINRAAKELGTCHQSIMKYAGDIVKQLRESGHLNVTNHKVVKVEKLKGKHDVYCLTSPETGNFALESGVFVKNCGINCIVTPLEPEWEGHVTLEFANSTNLPAKMYVGAGCAQLQFHKGDAECEVSYKDRNGKYQGQLGVTLPK